MTPPWPGFYYGAPSRAQPRPAPEPHLPPSPRPVLVVGLGGLGCPAALVLAQAGVPLRLVDDDVVTASNLQRQLLFDGAAVGRGKLAAGADRLRAFAPAAVLEPIEARFTAANAEALLQGCSLLLDGSDNFPTRFLANDSAMRAGLPLVHGAVLAFTGQVLVAVRGRGACYRCRFEAPPPSGEIPSCAEAGVLGALCGVVASAMAAAALRLLAGSFADAGRLQRFDGLAFTARTTSLRARGDCPACGAESFATLDPARYEPDGEACA